MARYFTVNRAQKLPLQFEVAAVPGSRKRAGVKLLEADVQRAVLKLLQQHPRVAFAYRVNSRVVDVADRSSKTGTRPMRTVPKGHPDICGMLRDGTSLYVECKSSDGELTAEQAAWLARVNKYHGLAFVARTAADVLEHIPLPNARSRGLDIV